VFAFATSLASDQVWNEWQQLPSAAKIAESELRNAAAKRIENAVSSGIGTHSDADLSRAFDAWNKRVQQLRLENSRTELVPKIVADAQHLG
jgi:hypothetical protein